MDVEQLVGFDDRRNTATLRGSSTLPGPVWMRECNMRSSSKVGVKPRAEKPRPEPW